MYNWDDLQRQNDEANPNCPWMDDEDEENYDYQAEDEAEDEVLGDE